MRSIWSGNISFGLVNIPVNLISAVTQTGIDFNLVHKDDFCPINYARVCRRTGQEIPYDEIVRAFEYKKNQYVVVEDEDFEAANVKKYNSIIVLGFVKKDSIEKIYYEKPYYIRPQKDAERPYSLFLKTLQQTKKIAIGKFVLRNREHLVTIESENEHLVLYQLRFDQEIRKPDFSVESQDLDRKELDLARSLVDSLSEDIDVRNFRDTYTDELMSLIKQKAKGEKVLKNEFKEEQIPDLISALEQSLKESSKNETERVRTKKESTKIGRASTR